jgi:hypothetical protein
MCGRECVRRHLLPRFVITDVWRLAWRLAGRTARAVITTAVVLVIAACLHGQGSLTCHQPPAVQGAGPMLYRQVDSKPPCTRLVPQHQPTAAPRVMLMG